MNYKMMGRLIALILAMEAVFMLPALLICLYDGRLPSAYGFLYTIGILIVAAGALALLCRRAKAGFYAKEGMVCVGVSWILLSLLGCLPFYFSHQIPSLIDAFFEMVSGFTTTGASILKNVEAMDRGMLFWRSFSHWLGGMGVLVFLLAVAPVSGKNEGFTMHLLRAESPGPSVGKLVPRMKKSARLLYLMYIVLTIVDIIFLLAGGMPLFEALCVSFGTAGTGGFGILNDSAASYSPYIQTVCTVFMLLFGVNFSCYYLLLLRQWKSVWQDEELRLYLGTFAVSTVLIVLNLGGYYKTLGETVRHAAFQVSSIMTTTGFSTTDFDLWPAFSRALLLCLMLIGASAGSTGGGLKFGRLLLLGKALRRNIRKMLHPQQIQVVRLNGHRVDEKILSGTTVYLTAYVMIVVVSFLLISFDNFSLMTNLSAVVSCFNNIGPGLELVGPMCNFSLFSPFSKLILIVDMLAGRLEVFPILVLFSRNTWRRR